MRWSFIIALALVVGAWMAWDRLHGQGAAQAQPNPYSGMRELAFSTKPKDIGFTGSPDEEATYGVIIEFRIDRETATVVSFASGDASIYLSTGGAMIGGVGQPRIAQSAKAMIATGQSELGQVPFVDRHPKPSVGQVTIYLLTTRGLRGTAANEAELEGGKHPLSPLFASAQDVITAYRTAR